MIGIDRMEYLNDLFNFYVLNVGCCCEEADMILIPCNNLDIIECTQDPVPMILIQLILY